MTANPVRRVSEAEYLEIERRAETKSGFYDGEMFGMAGGTVTHSLITTNLLRELGNKLKGKPCLVFDSNLRIKVEATGLFTYPDASVVSGPRKVLPGTDDILLNPTLIAEVLSPASEAYDRGTKFENYRRIPSLTEYLMISQKSAHVELFFRRDNQWSFQEASEVGASLQLPMLSITLSLSEIFANVEFKDR
jgi:Uma2 family endonuclease